MPCSLIEIYLHFRGACRLRRWGDGLDSGGSKHLQNVSQFHQTTHVRNMIHQRYSVGHLTTLHQLQTLCSIIQNESMITYGELETMGRM